MDDPDHVETEHILGLDLGQASDPSALTVTEKRVPIWTDYAGREVVQKDPPNYAVVWIERFDLGTPYREVVSRTAAIKRAPETGPDPELVMDATGVGAPVVEMFEDEGLDPVRILFTSGDSVNRKGKEYRVPKADLATQVQSLLQAARIAIVEDLELAPQLVEEMKRFRVKWTQAGHARFEHATEADSDDVLLSLACALWYAERGRRVKEAFRSVSQANTDGVGLV